MPLPLLDTRRRRRRDVCADRARLARAAAGAACAACGDRSRPRGRMPDARARTPASSTASTSTWASASAASAASSPATSRTAIRRRSTGAASARSKAAAIPNAHAVVPVDGLQSLPRADLPERLPGRRLHEGPGHRHRAPQRRRLHRLPVLHLELLLRRAAVQPRARRRRQVRHVPRPPRPGQAPACVSACPEGAIADRDRQRRRVARRGRRRCSRRPGVPVADGSLSTTRITLPANLPPERAAARPHARRARAAALAAGRHAGADAALGRRVRHDLAAAAARRRRRGSASPR